MNIRVKIAVSLLCIGALSGVYAADFDDYGRVLNVAPQVERINQPHRECQAEQVVEPQQRRAGGAIVGGLVGGALGNQVGEGRGRTAATIVGAIAGAVTGDRIENEDNRGVERTERVCHMVDHWENVTSGYAVTYEYHGHRYTSVMPNDPGDRIGLHISITPRP